MALLTPTTTGSTPLSQYHSLDASPALATSVLSTTASSSSLSLTAEDEGKHGSLCNVTSRHLASFGNLRETICHHGFHYREHHDHREPRFAAKTQGKTKESGVSVDTPPSSFEQHGLVVDAEEGALYQGYSLVGYLDAHHRALLRRVRCSDPHIRFVTLLRCGPTQR